MKPKVSILTPCYNSERFIERLLNSVLNQTYDNIEFIIINDGSTDDTVSVLEKYKEKFQNKKYTYKIISQENAGQASAINNGLKYVTGKYLVWPDSDDFYENDSIECMVKFLEENSDYSAVRGAVNYIKEEDLSIIKTYKTENPNNTNLFDNYIMGNDIYCYPGCIMINFDVFKKNNKGLDIICDSKKIGQNWQLLLPITYKQKVGYLEKVIYNYLVRSDSHSRTEKDSKELFNIYKIQENTLNKIINKIVCNLSDRIKYKIIVKKKYIKIKLLFILRNYYKKIFKKK